MNLNATLIVQFVVFLILAWFTMKFVWPPLAKALDDRAKKIADGLAAAERGKQDLELAERRAQEALDKARQQAADIIAQTEKRAAAIIEEAKTAAKGEADRMIAGAKAELEQSVERAKAELRNQVATLAVAGAERILKREVDQKAHADILGELRTQF